MRPPGTHDGDPIRSTGHGRVGDAWRRLRKLGRRVERRRVDAVGDHPRRGRRLDVSFVVRKILDAVMGLRVEESQEEEGLDLAPHDERGYIL